MWSGGQWPFSGNPNSNSQKINSNVAAAEVQFEIITPDLYKYLSGLNVSLDGATMSDTAGNVYEQKPAIQPSAFPPIVTGAMKDVTSSQLGGETPDQYLLGLAQAQRQQSLGGCTMI